MTPTCAASIARNWSPGAWEKIRSNCGFFLASEALPEYQNGLMKAAVFIEGGGPEVLRYQDVSDPVCPPDSVVVDVKAISVEGDDVLCRAASARSGEPRVLGHQCAGVISAVGADVHDRRVGQRVTCIDASGAYAEKRAVPARSTWLVPAALSLDEAACVPIAFALAHECLFEFGRLRRGERVLVHGAAGGVGLAAIQLARRAGAIVYATASSERKLDRIRRLGVQHAIHHGERDVVAAIAELTDGRGVDLVVDPVGGAALQQSLSCLAHRGRVLSCGNASRAPLLVDVSGMSGRSQSLTRVDVEAERRGEGEARISALIADLLDEVASGRLEVVIDRRYPLAEASTAHAHVESRAAVGRALLIP